MVILKEPSSRRTALSLYMFFFRSSLLVAHHTKKAWMSSFTDFNL